MQFTYQARDKNGKDREGVLTADSAEEASRLLRQEGCYLLSLEEKTAETAEIALFQKKISRSDIVYLSNQLAVMVDAGVPLATALGGLAKQAVNPTLQTMLQTIERHVQAGEDFSSALGRFPKYFDSTYINLVKASEASGTLAPMLDRIANQMSSELDTRKKVQGALMYPAAMLVMCISVSTFLLAYVFPKLTPMFKTRKVEIPKPTLFLMTVSDLLTNHWYYFVAGIILLVGFILYARKQHWGRIAFDWMWLNVPILGNMMQKLSLSRSIRTLATTINAGVPVLEALELTAGVSNNLHYEKCWRDVAEKVTGGKQIYEALEGNPLFPQTLLQMVSSGESTGKLGQVLNKVSDYYDRELANAVKSATSMIEPIMVFIMGGVIGTIALAMLLPIFKLSGKPQ